MILISPSPHIVYVALFSASSAKNASFFPIMNIHLLREKTANVNLCLFCRLGQHYKVHTYVISMEFSAVNRRRPSCETLLGPGAKDGCFRRLRQYKRSGVIVRGLQRQSERPVIVFKPVVTTYFSCLATNQVLFKW